MRRLDAEGDDPALGGDGGSAPAGFMEFERLANNVIGGEHEHQSLAITLGC